MTIKELIEWLDAEGIPYQEDCCFIHIYSGSISIDKSDPETVFIQNILVDEEKMPIFEKIIDYVKAAIVESKNKYYYVTYPGMSNITEDCYLTYRDDIEEYLFLDLLEGQNYKNTFNKSELRKVFGLEGFILLPVEEMDGVETV